MSKVAIREVQNYNLNLIKDTIYSCLEEIGFDLEKIRGKRVVVKPNLLSASKPEQAIITHPQFFHAVVKIIRQSGAIPVLVESPALHSLNKVFKASGYDIIIEQEGVEVVFDHDILAISNNNGTRYKHFEIIKQAKEADFIFNLPKFKTHGLTYMTGAQKNLFGLIPGMAKTQWHLKANTRLDFCEFLADYFEAIKMLFNEPKQIVHLMDAIWGMEGNGPGASGIPRKIGAVIVGLDAVAVDFIASSLVGFDTRLINLMQISSRRGLGNTGFDRIEFDVKLFDRLKLDDFKPAPMPINVRIENIRWLTNLLKRLAVEKPVPVEGKCTLCYQCRQICSAKAIDKGEKVPVFDYNKCIRCFCCMEICPEGAITLKKNLLSSIFKKS